MLQKNRLVTDKSQVTFISTNSLDKQNILFQHIHN